MNREYDRWEFATRSDLFLRWMQRLFFITGVLAVGYVVLSLLSAKLYQEAAGNILDKQIKAQEQQSENLPRTAAKESDVLGRIEIPRLGMATAILEGTTSRTLRLGVGHINGTAYPGEAGNVGIAGHRDTYFRALKDIRPGDKIQIQTATGLSHYAVDWIQIVMPEDTEILTPTADSTITLVTCYPFHFVGAAPKRFVVRARKE